MPIPKQSGFGALLQGFGPGLLGGIGNLLQANASNKTPEPTAKPSSFDKGGMVQKTGTAMVHKGEEVIPKDKMADGSLYRAIHHMNKGGLHRALGVPEGQKIPTAKLKAAKNSKNSHIAHMAHFAETLKGLHKGK